MLALAYLLPFRAYGLNVEDEGTLLYQILRVARGELPYVDFSTGYTPGFFFLGAGLWRAAGDLVGLRTLLALVHALTVAGLAGLVARLARPTFALLVPLLYLAFIPVFPGEFCAFNVPYPAWFATLGWVATAAAMLAFLRRRRRVWLVVAGLGAAATFGMKPNAGVFAIAAATAVLLALTEHGRRGGPASAALWLVLWGGILTGVWVTLGPRPRPLDALVYLAPLAAVLVALVTRERVRRAFLAGDAAALLAPFAALSLPWLGFFLYRLGTVGFLREVLLIGSGAERLFYLPYPAFEPWALVVAALAVGFAAAGALVRRGRIGPRTAAAGALVATLAGTAAVARLGLMPERLVWSVIWQLESAGFPLTLAAHAGGVVWLWRQGGRAGSETATALLLFALFMHLQLYPRTDFMHLVMAAPLTAVFAAFLLEQVLRWWERGLAAAGAMRARRAVALGASALLAAVIALRVSPSLGALAGAPRVVLPFAVAPVGIERAQAADLQDLGAAARTLARAVHPGEPSLGFPAIDLLLFLTGARNPTAHSYFYPGRPDHREEAEIVDVLAAVPPAALATLTRHFTFFDQAPAYYFLLRRFVQARYELAGRYGRFDVLARRAEGARPVAAPVSAAAAPPPAAAAPPSAAPAQASAPSASQLPSPGGTASAALAGAADLEARLAAVAALAAYAPADVASTLLDAATADEPVLRRAALQALLTAIAREPVRGLETYVAARAVDRRHQVLLLRTIRGVREVRAASYLFVAAASGDPRLIGEALEAMSVTRAELIARLHLWAGAEEPAVWPGREALLAAVGATLGDLAAPARAAAFAAHVAGALADAGAVPALRARLRAGTPARGAVAPRGALGAALADPATTASAAAALAGLDPERLACELTALLARDEPEISELVPTILLRLAEAEEPVRSEARACIGTAVGQPGAGQAEAVWIAAALGDSTFAPVLREALAAPAPEVRRAAAWALGEMPGDAVTAAALARAAGDADEIVRRLAAGAAAKHAGRTPRALHGALFPGEAKAG
jgi:hypothetical protein